MVNNRWFGIAAIFCGLSVAIGAFGAHAMKEILDDSGMQTWNTSVKYMMFHSTALLITSFAIHFNSKEKLFRYASIAFVVGIVLFSGSLFLLAITGIRPLGAVTPVGGIFQIVGWICLAIAGFKKQQPEG